MALQGALAENTRRNEAVERGEIALDASNPTEVATGLTTITSVSLTLEGSSAPGLNTSILTYTVSEGTLSIFAWKPTSNSNPTLVASTGTETVAWIVIGKRRL